MKRLVLTSAGLLAATVLLSACGDKPQGMGGSRYDAAPYAGVGNSPFKQEGWTAGDKNSWEQQLKARAQYGMNDHSRVTQQ